jgi:hypothetical protein
MRTELLFEASMLNPDEYGGWIDVSRLTGELYHPVKNSYGHREVMAKIYQVVKRNKMTFDNITNTAALAGWAFKHGFIRVVTQHDEISIEGESSYVAKALKMVGNEIIKLFSKAYIDRTDTHEVTTLTLPRDNSKLVSMILGRKVMEAAQLREYEVLDRLTPFVYGYWIDVDNVNGKGPLLPVRGNIEGHGEIIRDIWQHLDTGSFDSPYSWAFANNFVRVITDTEHDEEGAHQIYLYIMGNKQSIQAAWKYLKLFLKNASLISIDVMMGEYEDGVTKSFKFYPDQKEQLIRFMTE